MRAPMGISGGTLRQMKPSIKQSQYVSTIILLSLYTALVHRTGSVPMQTLLAPLSAVPQRCRHEPLLQPLFQHNCVQKRVRSGLRVRAVRVLLALFVERVQQHWLHSISTAMTTSSLLT